MNPGGNESACGSLRVKIDDCWQARAAAGHFRLFGRFTGRHGLSSISSPTRRFQEITDAHTKGTLGAPIALMATMALADARGRGDWRHLHPAGGGEWDGLAG